MTMLILNQGAEASRVEDIARTSLQTNIVTLKSGAFLSAGAHQFRSFWTRDFCFSSRGLLAINKGYVVKNHLNYLINNRRHDDLVPLYVDSMTPTNRVISDVIFKAIRLPDTSLPMTDKIKPFYLVNNKFEAIDSNLMVLYASLLYYQKTNDAAWFNANQAHFKRIFNFYNTKKSGLLIIQAEHADWQDSARRKGIMFFTNLLYYHMAKEYKFMNDIELQTLRNKIVEVFYEKHSGLFRSMEGRNNISLEGNLWAIEHDLLANRDTLYKNLTNHPLFTKSKSPGFATYPSYTKDDTYIQVKVVGLQEYHGSIYWSWLMAYSAKVAYIMNDIPTYNKIHSVIEKILTRDQVVSEIYNNNEEITPFRSLLYQAEYPFSWGSAFILDMEKTARR